MKNCGGPVHDEVATREFMEELRNVANVSNVALTFARMEKIDEWNCWKFNHPS